MDDILIDSSELAHQERAFTFDHELLERTLREARERAGQQASAVLASVTQAITWFDPLDVFAACQSSSLGESFFWERPAENSALVGVGTAEIIQSRGEHRFHDTSERWRTLIRSAVIARRYDVPEIAASGPTFFGGFAFDALAPRTELWRDFPDGLLVLPSLMVSYSPKGAILTLNAMVTAHDDAEMRTQALLRAATHLFMTLERIATRRATTARVPQLRTYDLLSASQWHAHVAEVASKIRAGRYEKVVLARGVRVLSASGEANESDKNDDTVFDIVTVLRRLRRSYPGAYVFAMQRGQRFFVGATPERLVQAQDGKIETMALAGSARRGATPQEDEQIGAALLASSKNNTEHAIVVSQVREALLNHCQYVQVDEKPHLLKLKNVQHLQTPITGTLRAQGSILDVVADLHPTPAVGGFPRQQALEEIRRVEQLDRGWYAGPLGWLGAAGHGEFAVALRSGLIDMHEATLFAGCGIVGDSDPQGEYEESCLKLQVMLRALSETWKG